MFRKQIHRASVVALAFLSGCLRETALDPGTEPEVVVQCILAYPQEEQELRLCYTMAPGQKTSVPIDDATILLSDLTTGKQAGAFRPCGEGRWILDGQVIPGHDYRLEVTVPGHSPIRAETRIPNQHRVHYQHHALSGTYWNEDKMEFYSIAVNSNLYFSGTRFYADDFGTESLWVFSWICDALSERASLGRRLGTSCFAADPFNYTGEIMEIPEQNVDTDDHNRTVYLRDMFSHCPYHLNYLRIQNPGSAEWEETEYSDNIHWNESGRKRQTFFYVEGDVEEGYEGLPGRTEPTSWGELSYEEPSSKFPGESCIEMMTVSDEYDRYLKEVTSYEMRHQEGDLTVLYERENVYSNILGGMGIFGARISYYLPWKEAGIPYLP